MNESSKATWKELESAAVSTLKSLLGDPATPHDVRLQTALAILDGTLTAPGPTAPAKVLAFPAAA
jgi:hypothetical protein